MSDTVHAIKGASSSERWMTCHGSIALGGPLPEPPQSFFAAQGTAAHAVGERALKEKKAAKEYLNLQIVVKNGEPERWFPAEHDCSWAEDEGAMVFEVDPEMVAAVQVYVTTCRETMNELLKLKRSMVFEIEASYSLEFVRPNMFGTSDFTALAPGKKLVVIDYKHGAGKVVHVEDNSQGMYYALGALRALCWDSARGEWDKALMPEEVEIVIVQPRAAHANGAVRRWIVTPEYLINDFAKALGEASDKVDEAEWELAEPGIDLDAWAEVHLAAGDHCQFCKAKGLCPKLAAVAKSAFQDAFNDISVEDLQGAAVLSNTPAPKVKKGQPKPEKPKDIADRFYKERAQTGANRILDKGREALTQSLLLAPLVEEWLSGVASAAQAELEAGRKVPGYKLVLKTGQHRRWKDANTVAAELELLIGPELLFTPPKLRSPAQVEVLEGMSTELIKDLLADAPEKLTLTHESDKRPEVIKSAALSFAGEIDASEVEDSIDDLV
jgi:hypothetical protein